MVMGVVNTTPDSFSDGGKYLSPADAVRRVEQLFRDGAEIIDIGAESSRPRSAQVPAAEQLLRLDAALGAALDLGAFVSIDTTSPEVAAHCLRRGARMINDVSFLRDVELAAVTAAHDAYLLLNHSRAPMAQMTGFSRWPDDDYTDIVADLVADWGQAKERAMQAGVAQGRLVFDPGFGFSKNARHCFELLARLGEFRQLGVPIAAGPGRKSFIADLDQSPPERRLGGTIAAALLCAQAGADVLRVHDVFEVRQALQVWRRQLDRRVDESATSSNDRTGADDA